MTYEIPVDGYEGRVSLQTVARRIARACVHFLQVCACSLHSTLISAHMSFTIPKANMIPISWDRVMLYHLEEHSPGIWQPVLSTS